MTYPETVKIIELETAPFRNSREADKYAREHGIIGMMSDIDTNGKGSISISARSLDKMLSGSAVTKRYNGNKYFKAVPET